MKEKGGKKKKKGGGEGGRGKKKKKEKREGETFSLDGAQAGEGSSTWRFLTG